MFIYFKRLLLRIFGLGLVYMRLNQPFLGVRGIRRSVGFDERKENAVSAFNWRLIDVRVEYVS